jgi:type II secretory pathway component PulK
MRLPGEGSSDLSAHDRAPAKQGKADILMARFISRDSGKQAGSILIVCFFVLVLITMFTLTVGYAMRQKFQVLSRLDVRQKLRLVGDAGVQKSIYVLLKSREKPLPFDSLNQSWSRNEAAFKDVEVGDGSFSVFYDPELPAGQPVPPGEGRQYGLIDEERKINLNLIKSPEVLLRLFMEVASLDKEDARGLVDSIQDWEDADDDPRASGAESRYYKDLNPGYLPRNGKMATLAELQWIKGLVPEIYQRIRPYVTLDSSGQVNLNTASRAALEALGFLPSFCDKIIAYRAGRDKVEGTADDQAFDDLSTVPRMLANGGYLDDNERSNFESVAQTGMLTLKSRFFSTQVVARLNHKTQSLRIVAVFDEKGVIKRWEESFVVS